MFKTAVRVFLLLFLISLSASLRAQSQQSNWIWFPGDFEIWLSNEVQTRRTERDVIIPPFWRMDNHYPLVSFHKDVQLEQPERIKIITEGKYSVSIDNAYVQGDISEVSIPAGKHSIKVLVYNPVSPPSIFVEGKTIRSNKTWGVSAQNAKMQFADSWTFNSPSSPPSAFKLNTTEKKAEKTDRSNGGVLADFGRETFGFVKLHNVSGRGNVTFYYGESLEEALDTANCETYDRLHIEDGKGVFTSPHSRAYRYVNIQYDSGLHFDDVSMLYEYLPVDYRGSFTCSDEEVNKIWEVSAYTLHLSTREFFLDGIKRDRWLWSGDAYQSYLMNYYLFFDNASVKRTTWALRGKDPVETHVNTILDYSFYWFMGIYDYYLYTGDIEFLKQVYPKMVSLMNFCMSRRNKEGMVEGLPGDWVFLDWAPMSKTGELSAEQLLFCRSLETMALCASLAGDEKSAGLYKEEAEKLRSKVIDTFWDPAQRALVHSRENNQLNKQVTRYANMFAMMFGYLSPEQTSGVADVLLSDKVQKITTPYMRFYESEALCAIGKQAHVLKEMKNYWGGMLKLGATSFWEEYNPDLEGAAHYAMYGRKYGKSLCHAWGASPIYLLGKYYLGVKPLKAGYEEYVVEPELGGLQWMKGKVPTPNGDVEVEVSGTKLKVKTPGTGSGTLRFKSSKRPVVKGVAVKATEAGVYEIKLAAGNTYEISYRLAGK